MSEYEHEDEEGMECEECGDTYYTPQEMEGLCCDCFEDASPSASYLRKWECTWSV
jgi:uncharacterized OB-fold protein